MTKTLWFLYLSNFLISSPMRTNISDFELLLDISSSALSVFALKWQLKLVQPCKRILSLPKCNPTYHREIHIELSYHLLLLHGLQDAIICVKGDWLSGDWKINSTSSHEHLMTYATTQQQKIKKRIGPTSVNMCGCRSRLVLPSYNKDVKKETKFLCHSTKKICGH